MITEEFIREQFEAYIRHYWKKKFHNFSIKDDGEYFYVAMQDAFDSFQAGFISGFENANIQ
jgi:hypothetical protein